MEFVSAYSSFNSTADREFTINIVAVFTIRIRWNFEMQIVK